MKISQMTTEQATDVLCEITPSITEILSDTDLIGELNKAVNAEATKTMGAKIVLFGEKITKIIPILLKKKRKCVYQILGVLNEKTVDEISKQSFLTTALQIREITKDKDLIDFFKSCRDSEGSE